MNESLVKYSAACLGMPHSMFYDESASNRATMIGKIDLTIETVMNPLREWLDRSLSPQTYDKWFRQLYQNNDELLKKFRVKMVFDDLHISEWYDKVEAVNELDSRKQLTDVSYGELLGIENYTGKVETDAQTIPGGSGGGKSFSFGDDQNSCAKPLNDFLNYLKTNAYTPNKGYGFIGWTIWSTGHGWGTYNLRVKPGDWKDRVIKNYFKKRSNSQR